MRKGENTGVAIHFSISGTSHFDQHSMDKSFSISGPRGLGLGLFFGARSVLHGRVPCNGPLLLDNLMAFCSVLQDLVEE